MNIQLRCPRCQCRKVRCARFDSWDGPVGAKLVPEWHCTSCGDFCHDPSQQTSTSPVFDITVGITVLTTMLVCVLAACIM